MKAVFIMFVVSCISACTVIAELKGVHKSVSIVYGPEGGSFPRLGSQIYISNNFIVCISNLGYDQPLHETLRLFKTNDTTLNHIIKNLVILDTVYNSDHTPFRYRYNHYPSYRSFQLEPIQFINAGLMLTSEQEKLFLNQGVLFVDVYGKSDLELLEALKSLNGPYDIWNNFYKDIDLRFRIMEKNSNIITDEKVYSNLKRKYTKNL